MTDMEKAELLNGILNYLKDNGRTNDLYGFRGGPGDPTIRRALKGLEKMGYVKLTIPEDSDEIYLVTLTDTGFNFIQKSKFI